MSLPSEPLMNTDLAEVRRRKGLMGGAGLVTSCAGLAASCANGRTGQTRIANGTRSRRKRTADTSMQVQAYQIHTGERTRHCDSELIAAIAIFYGLFIFI